MSGPYEWNVSEDEDDPCVEERPVRSKRRKTNTGKAKTRVSPPPEISLSPALWLDLPVGNESGLKCGDGAFEETIDTLLPDYIATRDLVQDRESERSAENKELRALSRYEATAIIQLTQNTNETTDMAFTLADKIALRKLKLSRERRRMHVSEPLKEAPLVPTSLTPISKVAVPPPAPSSVLDGLHAIRRTRYENSFLARLNGYKTLRTDGIIAINWETRTPWMDLMTDIQDHYYFAHPMEDEPEERRAPITYASLQPCHLRQVHELLGKVFWEGINVSDSLQSSPERCTVIATYRRLVVGAAFLSSPQETYITYLAVRPGWDNSQIATTMLYHLLMLHPNKDVTLHVSANNPAMLLYNRFGFKAEEFVAGFYEDYMDSQSRGSKNAFRLRLRR
ncbi:hypothetical protein BJ138DRAFT_1065488 [Hygrophoropsis aurantiaca]|uniref:Uncharacterized protein n=1 Tax=Hygrophoropsis aurantiaca TaxID=72124 RepID=A0ACB8AAH7_9AGAM|nr:hypothetical protein BJ138DRAFT_1065488 [Hygrophoropsis aurantiaca]